MTIVRATANELFPLRWIFILAVVSCGSAASSGGGGGGFGAGTPGGNGQPVHTVTTLGDSGPGSLRDALSGGSRHVMFGVAGTIALRSDVHVRGSFVTLSGPTTGPGITLRGAGLRLAGNDVHDVIVRDLRIRGARGDGIAIRDGAHNVLIDRVSIDRSGDGNLDITRGAHDVTVQWSIFSHSPRSMLIKYEAARISVHHNIFVNSQWRNPNVAYTDERSPNVAPGIVADVRNNLIWQWGNSGGGTILQCGAKVNVIGNFYASPNTRRDRQANAIVDGGCPNAPSASGPLFHTSGNLSADGLSFDLNSLGNQPAAFPGATVPTSDACNAARQALGGAGAQPRDDLDRRSLAPISLSC